MALKPLANPKGVKLECELCKKPAFISCTSCRVTNYCDEEHQNIDWIGIHEKICHLLPPLRMPVPFTSGSEEAREHQKEQKILRQKQLIELTRTTSQKLLFEEKYEYAVPAAMQSVKISIDVFGQNSIELVPSYLILGEACIGLGRLTQAQEYLSQAQWTVLKTHECSSELKFRLHRNLGMLHAGQGNSEDALKELAESIYQASLAYGANDVRTSGGYFHMANIFYQQDKMDIAFSIFDHLVSIWHKQLDHIVCQRMRVPTPPTGIGPAQYIQKDDQVDGLDETQGAEAAQILHCILTIRDQQVGTSPTILHRIYHTLGLLYIALGDFRTTLEYSLKSNDLIKSGAIKEEDKFIDLKEAVRVISQV